MIRTTKNLIRKSPEDFYKAVLSYRTTPLGPQMPSPAELMFGRKLPTSLPVHVRGPHNDPFRQKREEVLQKSANHYNTNSQELSDLNMNQPIFYQDVARKTWSPGVVFGCGPEPRSYTVKCSTTGRLLRRNRILLRPRQVTFSDSTVPSHIESDVLNSLESFNQEPSPPNNNSEPISNETSTSGTSENQKSDKSATRSGRQIRPTRRLIEEA